MADDRARRHLDTALDRVRCPDRDRRRLETWLAHRLRRHELHDGDVLHARFLARDAAPDHARGDTRPVPRRWDHRPERSGVGNREVLRPGTSHGAAGADPDARVPRGVCPRHALVSARDDARGLSHPRPGEGASRCSGAEPARGAECAAAGGDADRDQLRLRPLRCDRGGDDLLVAWARARHLRGTVGS